MVTSIHCDCAINSETRFIGGFFVFCLLSSCKFGHHAVTCETPSESHPNPNPFADVIKLLMRRYKLRFFGELSCMDRVTKSDGGVALKYFVVAALLQVVWGVVPSASKYVIDEIPVELYIAIRWTISGAIFFSLLFARRMWKPISFRAGFAVSVLGVLGYGVASLGTLYGLKIGGVANFALMAAFSPIVTSLVAIVALKERPHRYFYVALSAAVVGLSLLVLGKYQVSSWSVAGFSALLILIAFLLEAFVFVGSKRYKDRMHVVQYLAIAQVSAAAWMWILQFVSFKQVPALTNLTSTGMGAVVFVSVVACVLCYGILYWLLNYIDGHRLALFDGFHTLSAALFGYLLFGDPMCPLMIFGGLLILIGLVVGNLPARERETVPNGGSTTPADFKT